jgi:hypothetical protein
MSEIDSESEMTESDILEKIKEYLQKQNSTFYIDYFTFDYCYIKANRGQYILDYKDNLQDKYVVVYNVPFDVNGKTFTYEQMKEKIINQFVRNDIIPKGIAILNDIETLDTNDDNRDNNIKSWLEKPDNVYVPDTSIQPDFVILQETTNCTIAAFMSLLMNNDIFKVTEEEFRKVYDINPKETGFKINSETLGWCENKPYLDMIQVYIDIIHALGFTAELNNGKTPNFHKNIDVILCYNYIDNPPIQIKGFKLFGGIFGYGSSLYFQKTGHAIPFLTRNDKWWVMNSQSQNNDHHTKMFLLPDFEIGNKISNMNYDLRFYTKNPQSVVIASEYFNQSAHALTSEKGYHVFPSTGNQNLYAYANINPELRRGQSDFGYWYDGGKINLTNTNMSFSFLGACICIICATISSLRSF